MVEVVVVKFKLVLVGGGGARQLPAGIAPYDPHCGVASTHSAEHVVEEQVERAAAALTCVSRLKTASCATPTASTREWHLNSDPTAPRGRSTVYL